MKSFSEFPLSALVQSNLLKNGFTQPTAVQAQAIEPALAGRDVVATAQTGTGKTLAFVVPIIHLLGNEKSHSGVRVVILSPTRELAIQSAETFAKMQSDPDLAGYLVSRVAEHGRRRAAEMREVSQTLREVGVEPWMSEACARLQDGVVDAMQEQGIDYAALPVPFDWKRLFDGLAGEAV